MKPIHVSKYHGCGNDFILLNPSQTEGWSGEQKSALARAVCDRHLGIGADGMIIACQDPFFMEYYNADGSRADMCGNGIRTLTCFLKDQGLIDQSADIDTLAGLMKIQVTSDNPFACQVNMGKPNDDPAKICTRNSRAIWGDTLEDAAPNLPLYSLYMGTIHTVAFVDDAFDPSWPAVGQAVGTHPEYEKQTNVNFVQVVDPRHLKARTWERGCGMTLACGTGMCASAVTAHRLGLCESAVDVEMLAGTLHIEIKEDGSVLMSGPAKKIMEGEFIYEETA